MIQNPILPGFNPDPCICRKGDDYYLAVSSFEWLPGIPIYHSRDLKHWELLTHVLTDQVDLRRLPSSKGIWAPCLTYCEKDDLFYVVYGVMNSMNARYFDVDNFLITAREITGPWSTPVYLHSAGFDASLFHDDDGKKYLVSLEWETRAGYEKPGAICMVEYSGQRQAVVGFPQRIWSGGTDRGCIEAPHLYKRNGFYYIMCAEGGTGYNHCVTIGRAEHPFGSYVRDPENPIVTSQPMVSNERSDPDHLKPKYYNPESILQKSGHGSIVETQTGETYLVHLTSRPFLPELRCTLGRETAIQKMMWTSDGWLRMADGSNLAKVEVEKPSLPECVLPKTPGFDDFDEPELRNCYYAPRILPTKFTSLTARPGWLRIYGRESQTSLNEASILARKLTSVYGVTVRTKMDYHPEVHQHSAGLLLYYDNMNYVYLRKYLSQTLGQSAISIIRLQNGEKTEFLNTRLPVDERPLILTLTIEGRKSQFYWGYEDEDTETPIGETFDTSEFSDEYCKYGEFTGTMVGLTCADRLFHRHYADFDFLEYQADESIISL